MCKHQDIFIFFQISVVGQQALPDMLDRSIGAVCFYPKKFKLKSFLLIREIYVWFGWQMPQAITSLALPQEPQPQ